MGGFGSVYRVRKGDAPPVAMKVLLADLLATPQAIQRFEREVAAIQKVGHANCIQIFDAGRLSDGSPYFTMELLRGEDLLEHLKREGRMRQDELRSVLTHVCGALQAAHEQGIVHRDVKASNIFLCDNGEVKLLDFGIAKFVDMPGMTLTLTRQVVGTPSSMAPEQLSGGLIDARTDVYALGALAYYMLTGSQVFSASSATLLQHLHQRAARPRPSARVPVSSALDRVIVSAMAVDAGGRPVDADAFLKALNAALDGVELSEGEPARAAVVFGFLGTGEQSEAMALKSLAAMDAAMAVLKALGYEPLSIQSRGFVCARVLAHDSELGEDELVTIEKSFVSDAPGAAALRWKVGSVLCKNERPWSGDVLIPRFEIEPIDELGDTR